MLKREPYIDVVIGPQSYHKINEILKSHVINIKKEETEEASINEDLVKDNQLQHAVSLLSGWEVMKKVFKNLQVPLPGPESLVSMHLRLFVSLIIGKYILEIP